MPAQPNPVLATEVIPIESVSPDPANVRLHNKKNLDAIKGSLRRFGQQKPIVVDADGVIRAGNGTWYAAKELGWTQIVVVRSALNGPDAIAYAIADNRTAELADWDWEPLSAMLKDLNDRDAALLGETGWNEQDLAPLLASEWEPAKGTGAAGPDADSRTSLIAVTQGQRVIIDSAVAKVRVKEGDDKVSIGRCLELICADWLS